MDLRELADQMRETAKQNPHNQDRQFIMPEVCAKQIMLEGRLVNIAFTYNVWDTMPVTCWQVSCSDETQAPLPESIVSQVVKVFLGDNFWEFTDQMPPQMRFIRQFMQRIK